MRKIQNLINLSFQNIINMNSRQNRTSFCELRPRKTNLSSAKFPNSAGKYRKFYPQRRQNLKSSPNLQKAATRAKAPKRRRSWPSKRRKTHFFDKSENAKIGKSPKDSCSAIAQIRAKIQKIASQISATILGVFAFIAFFELSCREQAKFRSRGEPLRRARP